MSVASTSVTPYNSGRRGLRWTTTAIGLVALAAILQAVFGTHPDVSWLIHVAARSLDGAVPYRDLYEPNPPASFLIYIAPVVAGRLFGLRPEIMTDVFTFAGAALSSSLSGIVLIRARFLDSERRPRLFAAGLAVLLLLPLRSFAQREHIALIALLPAMATLAVRSAGRSPDPVASALAGLGAGLAIAIKPVFALALVGPVSCCLVLTSWRSALRIVEIWIAAAIATLYAAAVLVLYPDYASRILPLVLGIYVPVRLDMGDLLTLPALWAWAILVATYACTRAPGNMVGRILVLASVGFVASVLIQGKGFAYHTYPAVALSALACASAVRPPGHAAQVRLFGFVPALAAIFGALTVFVDRSTPALDEAALHRAVLAIASRPTIVVISADMVLSRAFVTELGGEWAASQPVAWVTAYASLLRPRPEDTPAITAAIESERDRYGADIDRNDPDIVLIDGDGWQRWTRHSPRLTAALSHYRSVGRFGDLIMLARAKPSGGPADERNPDPLTRFGNPAPAGG